MLKDCCLIANLKLELSEDSEIPYALTNYFSSTHSVKKTQLQPDSSYKI